MPYSVGNRMAVDSEWEFNAPVELKEKLNGKGYKNMDTGVFVPEEDAFEYAVERISQDEDLKQELAEWFYSGNWVKG